MQDVAGRSSLAITLAGLVGPDVLKLTDAANGWPARADLVVESTPVAVDLFVAPVTLGFRPARLDLERRFQNPGSERPITITQGRVPLLVGIWDHDDRETVPRPVLALADPMKRVGYMTRFSVFQDLATLKEAAVTGWSERMNSDGELIKYVLPALLPLAVGVQAGTTELPEGLVQAVVLGSGLAEGDGLDAGAAQRARRASYAIVRDARFSKRVIAAYEGLCAMCGLDVGLVQGAHIYPASAPGSQDEPWNGLSLCPNHHLAFDRHLVAVRPTDRSITFHESVQSQLTSPGVKSFVSSTFPKLTRPAVSDAEPKAEMFAKRYQHFEREYGWLSGS